MKIRRNLCICAVLAIALFVFVIVFESNRHDLSGTYTTCEFFPVTSITFERDGTFKAYNEYETLKGKYSKKKGAYSLQFTGGESKSANPVSNYEAASSGLQYELKAEKINDGQLRVYVIPKISYWAWLGKYADFYGE